MTERARIRALARKQLDQQFASTRPVIDVLRRPTKGWVRAIRDSLGMTANQLARRTGLSQPRVVAIEKAEVTGAIKLETLAKIAEGLNCRLVYALVPENSLDEMVTRRARRLAKQHLQAVSHSMALEDQAVPPKAAHLDEHAAEIVSSGSASSIWDD